MKQKNTYRRRFLGFVLIPELLNQASYAEEGKKLATKGDRRRFRLDLDFKY